MRRRRSIALAGAILVLNATLWLATNGFSMPPSLANYFFGPHLIRAEVVLKVNGVLHDNVLAQGRVTAVSPHSLTLLERDGTIAIVPISGSTVVTINGAATPVGALRRGMQAITIREGDAPATTVIATGRR